MSTREIVRRLRSWESGRPLARYGTLHHEIAEPKRTLIVSFIRMAGESRPWGIAWGHPDQQPSILSVPDGRVREDVATMCADFAEALLEHMRVHNWTYSPLPQRADRGDLRQVWVPNGQHVAMLHQLNYLYSQTKYGGTHNDLLKALGRLTGWLFRESTRIGHQHIIDASAALSEAYAFPAQTVRTAHLGYQLAWLQTTGDRAARLDAATAAETLPVSPTMDPRLEEDELEARVAKWQRARREGTADVVTESEIAAILDVELRRRWQLTRDAYFFLTEDERQINPGVEALIDEAHEEFWYQLQRIELGLSDPSQGPAFTAHPETDFHGSAAASRYLLHEAADEALIGHLIHDDAELFEEAVAEGNAIRVTVTSVRNEGSGRTVIPVWEVAAPVGTQTRLRENSRVVPMGQPGMQVIVREVQQTDDALVFVLEFKAGKTGLLHGRAKPVDPRWVGEAESLVVTDAADLTRRRSMRVWSARQGPGAWLTHGYTPPPVQIGDTANDSDVLRDDVAQIGGAA